MQATGRPVAINTFGASWERKGRATDRTGREEAAAAAGCSSRWLVTLVINQELPLPRWLAAGEGGLAVRQRCSSETMLVKPTLLTWPFRVIG